MCDDLKQTQTTRAPRVRQADESRVRGTRPDIYSDAFPLPLEYSLLL